jgi:hypothetical protein
MHGCWLGAGADRPVGQEVLMCTTATGSV